MFIYFAVPAFWFFMLSFVFLSRIIIMQRALVNFDLYNTREEQRSALIRFYATFCKYKLKMIVYRHGYFHYGYDVLADIINWFPCPHFLRIHLGSTDL